LTHILFHRFYDAGVPLKAFEGDAGNAYSIPEARALKIIEDLCDEHDSLEVSLDDGYRDAVEFLIKHHAQFPKVKWFVFLCPQRVLEQTNHAWDLQWTQKWLLASKELLLKAAQLPRVVLGCHTNNHLELASLSDVDLENELAESFEDFNTLFGNKVVGEKAFAFPYGTPNVSYDKRVLKYLGKWVSGAKLFSTESLWKGVGDAGVYPRVGILNEPCIDRIKAWKSFDKNTQMQSFEVLNF
jgi:peptidoglycan/xylan/chitin deacetylase (PgdA/CDA1 family)